MKNKKQNISRERYLRIIGLDLREMDGAVSKTLREDGIHLENIQSLKIDT